MTIFYIYLDGRLITTRFSQQATDDMVNELKGRHPLGKVDVTPMVDPGE